MELIGVFQTAAQVLYTRLNIPRPWSSSNKPSVFPGDSILIWSGAASVSFYAIQLAKVNLKPFCISEHTAKPWRIDRRTQGLHYRL